MTKLENVSNGDPEFDSDKGELLKSIQKLRHLVSKEKYLKVRNDNNFLLRYLSSSNRDPEIAFQKMQTYYRLKYQNPDWYVTKESIDSFKADLDNQLFFLLEDRDKFGKRIYVNKLGMIDSSKTTMARQSQLQDFFLESILDEEKTQQNGLSVIVDLKNFSWPLLKWLTPGNVSIAVKKIESIPLKKIEFHVINTSFIINAAVKLIWPFLSLKTKKNIHFHHDDWSSLHRTIDPDCLPNQYGGTKANVNAAKLLEIIPGSKGGFLDENLRLGYTQSGQN